MSVFLLGLHFHTEDPDCVNDTVNIFMFPDLSFSAGSEASMVTRIWDTALDANTLTSYAYAAALMKQQRIPPIVGWDAAGENLSEALVELGLDESDEGGRHVLLGSCLGS